MVAGVDAVVAGNAEVDADADVEVDADADADAGADAKEVESCSGFEGWFRAGSSPCNDWALTPSLVSLMFESLKNQSTSLLQTPFK